MKSIIFITILLGHILSQQSYAQTTYVDYYNQSMEAYKNQNYEGFLKAIEKADSLRPNHPIILYNLANGYTLNNELQKAIETLRYRSRFYAVQDFSQDEDLKLLQEAKEWSELVKDVSERNEIHRDTKLIFEFNKPGFHPEGMAYNESKKELYFSDVHTGTVYKTDITKGELLPLIDLDKYGYWSAMGLKVDPLNSDHLWVTTTALPNFLNYKEDDEGKSAVLLFNIQTGELLKAYNNVEKHRNFGEVFVSNSGTVYVTDSGSDPVIFRVDKEQGELVEAFTHEAWWNLQGLAESEDGKWLYVSDYITGIYKIDIQTKQIEPILEQNEWLRGGDGIYLKNNTMIVLQNGSRPKRIATIKLDRHGMGKLETLRAPHQADDKLEDPTMGTWVNDEFYYIANSPWGYYDEQNRPNMDKWPQVLVYSLSISN
jgi:sugar lactone lactonase YvrE